MKRKVMPNRLKYARINAGYSQKDVCDISGFISRNSLGNCDDYSAQVDQSFRLC